MNTLKKIYGTLALLLVCAAAWGQTVTDPDKIPTSGECIFKTVTQINLAARVDVNGSLVIRNEGSNPVTIMNVSTDNEKAESGKTDADGNKIILGYYTLIDMFRVGDGRTLEIDGGKGGIIIDGGSKLIFPAKFPQSITLTKDNGKIVSEVLKEGDGHKKLQRSCIYTAGTLILKNVTFVNGDFCNVDGGHIRINGPSGTTTIENCTFTRARSYQGCGISVHSQHESPTSSEDIAITITNSTFTECYLKLYPDELNPDKSGAVFRFNGTWCGNLSMTNCVMENNFTAGDVNSLQWNAIGNGTLEPKCIMKGCTFRNNVAARNGAAMLIEGTISFEEPVTEIYNNEAKGYGGGLWVNGYSGTSELQLREDPIKLDLNKNLKIYNNKAGTYGGGVVFRISDGCTLPATSQIEVNLNGADIYDNKSGTYGGGVYIENGSKPERAYVFSVNLNSGKVYGNTANDSGGGIYVEKADVHIGKTESSDSLSVRHNNAKVSGGGLYVHGGNVDIDNIFLKRNVASGAEGGGGAIKMTMAGTLSPTMTMKKGTITHNKSSNKGGAIHIVGGDFNVTDNAVMEYNTAVDGGAVAISSGNLNISGEVSVRNNTATSGGGGIYVSDGEVTIAKGEISRNTSSGDGGGLLVESTTPKTLTFDGGVFSWNRARCGGGIATEGPVNLSLSATVQNNYATNGGGIYLSKEAEMTFSDGLIRGNHANGTSDLPTAYQGTGATLQGVGGGVFLDSDTKLKFSMTQAFGIYSNVAEFAADDIFANGVSTNVDLPAVANMTLKDFDVPTNILYWMEDYKNSDTKYGTGVATDIGTTPSYRYQEALRDYKELRHLTGKTATGDLSDSDEKYLCLALGYELVYLTLIKEGLDFGDDATFVFSYKKEGDTDFTPYQKIIVTGAARNNKDSVWESIALPEGYWKIEESDWSWEYSDTPEYSYYHKKSNNELKNEDEEGKSYGSETYIKVENGVKTVKLTRDGVNAIKVKNTKIPVTDPAQYVRSFDFHKLNIMNPVE